MKILILFGILLMIIAAPLRAENLPIYKNCPFIFLESGKEQFNREINNNLVYQSAIVRTERRCQAEKGKISLRIGLVLRVSLGPLGRPGEYPVKIKISVTRLSDGKEVNQTTIPLTHQVSTEGVVLFYYEAPKITLESLSPHLGDDYNVSVALTPTA